MGSDQIHKSIKNVNHHIARFASMDCVAVWRSIGSNIFFEFGMPTLKRVTPKTRKSFMTIQGEVTIGIHADEWYLSIGKHIILTSYTVNDSNIRSIANRCFIGKFMPIFRINSREVLILNFGESTILSIHKNEYSPVPHWTDDEVTLSFPDVSFDFNYLRGFYKEAN